MKIGEIKKCFSLLPAAVLILSMFSCSSDDDNNDMQMEEIDPVVQFLEGSWSIANEEASLAVGPAAGSADWWFLPADEVSNRSCLLDDVWTFNVDGTFSLDQGGSTWLESWQGQDPEACGTPVMPHAGGSFTFSVSGTELTLNGTGAFIGLPKAINGAELSDGISQEPSSRTYTILEQTESPKRIKLGIAIAGEGNWTFILAGQ